MKNDVTTWLRKNERRDSSTSKNSPAKIVF